MNRLRIVTGLDLRQQSEAVLIQHFGKVGRHYYGIARAIDDRPVTANRVRKSVGSETTFEKDSTHEPALVAGLAPLLDDVWGYCERTGVRGRTVTLKVKYADFQQTTRSRTAVSPVANRAALERMTLDLLSSVVPLTKAVRLLGMALSSLQVSATPVTGQLRLNL